MVRNRFLACCLLVLSFGAVGQTREQNTQRLMDVMAANWENPSTMQQKVAELLATYTEEEAYRSQADVVLWGGKNKVLSPLEVSREMLTLAQRYAPKDDVSLDYWRYQVMISAKLDRGEIQREEYDYLEGRKMAEAQREADRRNYRPPQVYYPPPPDRVGPMLEAMGNAIKRRRPPVTTTNCAMMGNLVQCQSQ